MSKRPASEHGQIVIKKGGGKHRHEEHSSAWKVAFADFCLALMCLFLVLWVLAARDKEEAAAALAAAMGAPSMLNEGRERMIGEYQPGSLIPKEEFLNRPPPDLDAEGRRSLQSPEDLQALAERVRQAGEQVGLGEHITAVVTAQGLRIMIHDTDEAGMFRLGSATPAPGFAQLLRRIGPMFQEIDNQLVIAGHTDAVPFQGSGAFAASNWSLSMERALAARAYMLAGGMPPASVLQVTGMADAAPVDLLQPRASVNRRVELLVTTKDHAGDVRLTYGPLPAQHQQPLTPELTTSPTETPLLEMLRQQLLRSVGAGAQSTPAARSS